jgi:hypothetical protein
MHSEWQFRRAEPNGWCWIRVDRKTGKLVQTSQLVFLKLNDCVSDAKRYGFVPPPRPVSPKVSQRHTSKRISELLAAGAAWK